MQTYYHSTGDDEEDSEEVVRLLTPTQVHVGDDGCIDYYEGLHNLVNTHHHLSESKEYQERGSQIGESWERVS